MSNPFRSAWYATGLGEYRPCRYTYESYRYEAQPALDSRDFTGAFDWFGDPGEVDGDQVARLRALDRPLAGAGLALPPDFITFYSHSRLRYALDEVSVTGCWTDLSESPIVSPVDPGSRLVRFLRDQQDCAIWYLYLHRFRDPFVVFSHVDFADDDLGDRDPTETEIAWCAPTFEEFAFRFWLENRIWLRLHGNVDEPLDEVMVSYLSHFRTGVDV